MHRTAPLPWAKGWAGALAIATLLVAVVVASCPEREPTAISPLAWAPKLRGGWFAAWGEEPLTGPTARAELETMRRMGFEWLAYSPEIEMPDVTKPEFRDGTPIAEVEAVVRFYRTMGFRVFVLPRIESPDFYRAKNPTWRGDLKMTDDRSWDLFHERLGDEVVRYATAADGAGAELYALGLEYRQAVVAKPEAWRRMAERVRKVFRGRITYSANWYKEFEEVAFWDALDCIGIGAYFPLTRDLGASDVDLEEGWDEVLVDVERVAKVNRKSVVFTEVGFPTYRDAAVRPWEWTREDGKVIDASKQAQCYRSMFASLQRRSWFEGFFLWRYYNNRVKVGRWDYSPQNKAAEDVVRTAWKGLGKGAESAPASNPTGR